MNGELCSKCKTNVSLNYHRYCYTCQRLASGRPAVPTRKVDPTNKTMCCKCKAAPRQAYHNYCVECQRASNRAWVDKKGGHWNALTPTQKHKAIVRRYIVNLVKRGKILKQPCAVCADPNSEIHHLDYLPKTLNVVWLCEKHHVEAEREKRKDLPVLELEWKQDPRLAPPLERIASNSTVGEDGCFLWGGYCEGGHGRIGLKGKLYWVHRLAWELFNGPIPDDKWVLHKCIGHGNCWNPEHLYLGDALMNAQDRTAQGRDSDRSGEKNGRAILTIEQIKWIRAHCSDAGMTIYRLAKIFKVAWSTMQAVVSGKSWNK